MKEEKRITYQAGITRTPSDFLCKDGELAECINLTTDNEELKPMVRPKVKFNVPEIQAKGNFRILYVHRQDEGTRYIGYYDKTNEMVWGTEGSNNSLNMSSTPLSGAYYTNNETVVTSVGRTLIVSDSLGIRYYLWRPGDYQTGKYDKLNFPLPEIELEAVLETKEMGGMSITNTGKFGNALAVDDDLEDIIHNWDLLTNEELVHVIGEGEVENYNELVTGLYAKNLEEAAYEKLFAEPFFIRAALELYDGSYVCMTSPILLFPAITKNSCAFIYYHSLVMQTNLAKLWVRQGTDFSDYSDIVKDVVVFASKGVSLYNLNVDQPMTLLGNHGSGIEFADTVATKDVTYTQAAAKFEVQKIDGAANLKIYSCLKERTSSDIKRDIESVSVFYKIFSLGLKKTAGPEQNFIDAGSKIPDYVLPNLTSQPRLDYDDYYSHNKLTARMAYVYNSRLNLADVKRGMFEGFHYFMPLSNGGSYTYRFYVKIKTNDGKEVWVMHEKTDVTDQQGIYFFYPDPRAVHVTIYKETSSWTCVCDADLKEHRAMNGAYYLRGLPSGTVDPTVTPGQYAHACDGTNDNSHKEILSNYVLTSEVDNPWIFRPSGYNRIGTGRILGMSAVTMALSQDQRGPSPLVVFSESGVWLMSVDRTGLYDYTEPFTRDVLINQDCITQTDNAIFFVTKKGLMVATQMGVNGNISVKCVSEQMNGKAFDTSALIGFPVSGTDPADDWRNTIEDCQDGSTFLDYICSDNCRMAYDYADSRLMIVRPDKDYSFVYNMADGSFSKTDFKAESVVNAYPDYLMQIVVTESNIKNTKIYSLYEKEREEDVSIRQKALIITRPMKLAGPLTVTSLRELVNVGDWQGNDAQGNELSCVKTDVWVSDDLQKWYAMSSRFGAAARFFRIGLYIRMLPTERLSGTILMEQERRGNNRRA